MRTTIASLCAAVIVTLCGRAASCDQSVAKIETNQPLGVVTNNLAAQLERIKTEGEIAALGQWLADVEKLWPQHGSAYLSLMSQASGDLNKRLRRYLLVPRKQGDRESLLAFAQRLGTVRKLRIPDYERKFEVGNDSIAGPRTPEEEQERQRRFQLWARNGEIRSIQQDLEAYDELATRHFLAEAVAYLQGHLDDSTFVEEAVQMAQLTSGERQQLAAVVKPKKDGNTAR